MAESSVTESSESLQQVESANEHDASFFERQSSSSEGKRKLCRKEANRPAPLALFD